MNSFLASDYVSFDRHNELRQGINQVETTLKESTNAINRNLGDINLAVSSADKRLQDIQMGISELNDTLTFIGNEIIDRLWSIEHSLKYRLKTEASELTEMGMKLLKLDEADSAIRQFEKAIELDPLNFTSHFALAVTYFNDNDFDTAFEYSSKSIKRLSFLSDSKHGSADIEEQTYLLHSKILIGKGEIDAAYLSIKEGMKRITEPRTIINTNKLTLMFGEEKEKVGSLEPSTPTLYYATKLAFKVNNLEMTRELITYIIQKNPKLFSVILFDPSFKNEGSKKEIESILISVKEVQYKKIDNLFHLFNRNILSEFDEKIQRFKNEYLIISKPFPYYNIYYKRIEEEVIDHMSVLERIENITCSDDSDNHYSFADLLALYDKLYDGFRNGDYLTLTELPKKLLRLARNTLELYRKMEYKVPLYSSDYAYSRKKQIESIIKNKADGYKAYKPELKVLKKYVKLVEKQKETQVMAKKNNDTYQQIFTFNKVRDELKKCEVFAEDLVREQYRRSENLDNSFLKIINKDY